MWIMIHSQKCNVSMKNWSILKGVIYTHSTHIFYSHKHIWIGGLFRVFFKLSDNFNDYNIYYFIGLFQFQYFIPFFFFRCKLLLHSLQILNWRIYFAAGFLKKYTISDCEFLACAIHITQILQLFLMDILHSHSQWEWQ